MKRVNSPVILIVITCVAFFANLSHAAQIFPIADLEHVNICEFNGPQNTLPTFNERSCKKSSLANIDPQNTEIWVTFNFNATEALNLLIPPYGFFIYGKAASRVYLNGKYLGNNGQPAFDSTEIKGKMDAVFYIPEGILKEKNNNLVLRLSAQHSITSLSHPINFLGLGQYGDPRKHIQKSSNLGLILIGAFLVGALYFLNLSLGKNSIADEKIFTCLCFLAGIQLFLELSRVIFNYEYPFHDLRLMAITLCSFLFGVLLLIYSSINVAGKQAIHWIYSGLVLSIICVIFSPNFDAKTIAGIFVPSLLSSIQLMYFWKKNKNIKHLNRALIQASVVIMIIYSPVYFHEIVYFVVIGGFLSYLFIQHARERRFYQEQLQSEQSKIAKLEYKLAQNIQAEKASKIKITIAGKVELVNTDDIAFCKAAGDYCELHLESHQEKLYSGSLKQLEELMPSTFIRVHRSYLVNLNKVLSLSNSNGDATNIKSLLLTNQTEVPVSRRLLPLVRNSLINN